jgi:hypothetical protein
MKSPILLVALMVMTVSGGLNFASAFAMHDSTLNVNTWIASNNSTQLHTTDLNKGPVSPTTSTAANTAEETTGPSTITPTTPDEAEDDVGSEDDDEEADGDADDEGDSDGEEEE